MSLVTNSQANPLVSERHSLLAVMVAAVPVSIMTTMSWFGTYTFINGYYTRVLGKSNAEWTALTLWFNGSMMIWPFLCVPFVSRVGHRRAVVLAMAATCLAYLGTAFAQSTLLMSAICVGMAIAPSASAVGWLPLVIQAGGSRPGMAIAACTVVATVVGALSLAACGRLPEAIGYRATFLLIAALCGVCIFVFCLSSMRLTAPRGTEEVGLLSISRRDMAGLARGPFAFLVLAGICMEPFNFHTANQLFPNVAHDYHGLSAGAISLIVALGRLPALGSLMLLARVVDDVNIATFYGTGLLVAGLCVAGLGLVGSVPLLVLMYCGYYFFHGMVWGTDVAAVNGAVDQQRLGHALAIMTSASTGATFAVGIVHNRLISAGLPLQQMIAICGAMGAASGLLMIAYSLSRFSDWSRPRRR